MIDGARSGVAQSTRPASADLLSTLRPAHPRLMVLDPDVARIRELIKTDPQVRRLRDEIHASAMQMMDAKPVVHELVGPRLLGQSRTCLHRVSTLAGLYRLEGNRAFAERTEQEMLTAAAFPDWNPRHFLDTAEMTNALAIGYDWLFDVLPESSRKVIRTAIVEKGLKPGLAVYRKRTWWATARHNWNQVCNGGMIAGALAIAHEEPEVAREIVTDASESIKLAMATLAPDGGWPEGPGYWSYAMHYTAYFLAAAHCALGTDFGLKDTPGFADTGLFRIHCIGPTGLVFNFADGGSRPGSAPEMMYFARLFNRPVYAAHERRFLSRAGILDLLWYDPSGTGADVRALPTDRCFRGINVVFLRSGWDDPNATFVGFKGGDNAANHSHLDLGTFVLDALGQRWAIDLGGDNYNMPGYFGDKRWTYYRLRTAGHNTLVLGGENQKPKARAPIIAFKSTPERSCAVADLTAAYAGHAQRVQRGVALLDHGRVLVQDEIEPSDPVEAVWSMHTNAQIAVSGPDVTLTLNNTQMHVQLVEPSGASWGVKEVVLDPPQEPLSNTRKLFAEIGTRNKTTTIAVLFQPENSHQSSAPELKPLSSWNDASKPQQ